MDRVADAVDDKSHKFFFFQTLLSLDLAGDFLDLSELAPCALGALLDLSLLICSLRKRTEKTRADKVPGTKRISIKKSDGRRCSPSSSASSAAAPRPLWPPAAERQALDVPRRQPLGRQRVDSRPPDPPGRRIPRRRGRRVAGRLAAGAVVSRRRPLRRVRRRAGLFVPEPRADPPDV